MGYHFLRSNTEIRGYVLGSDYTGGFRAFRNNVHFNSNTIGTDDGRLVIQISTAEARILEPASVPAATPRANPDPVPSRLVNGPALPGGPRVYVRPREKGPAERRR